VGGLGAGFESGIFTSPFSPFMVPLEMGVVQLALSMAGILSSKPLRMES